jgi:hypothetical protein
MNRWRGQYHNPTIVERIRRTISGGVVAHKTVLVDFEHTGVTGPQVEAIMMGWDASTVKACGCIHTLPHPLPADVRIGVVQSDHRGGGDHRYRRNQA